MKWNPRSESLAPLGELELGFQVLHAPVALDAVTGPAQELQILQVIGAALCSGDDVIDFQVSRLEVGIAPGAVSSLDAVECLSVRSRDRERPEIRPAQNVLSVDDLAPQALACLRYGIRPTPQPWSRRQFRSNFYQGPRRPHMLWRIHRTGPAPYRPRSELARMIRFKRAMGFCVG